MKKKSLVIGINNYDHFSQLDKCINDATDFHNFLKNNGFESTLLIDSKQKELVTKIAEFKDTISEDTISLIYFSGHGLQDEKYNYIVVSDSDIKISADIKYNCIQADDLLITNSTKNLHFLILDACRDNPFNGGRKSVSFGLLKMSAPAGTLIAFSTSPNTVSIERENERNGVYTKHLLEKISIPNIPAELLFKRTRNAVMIDTSNKQIPWEESSLSGEDFYFVTKDEQIELIQDDNLNVQSQNNFKAETIYTAPTIFFHDRLCSSFPDAPENGFKLFTEKEEINNRLKVLLAPPIIFHKSTGHGVNKDPIWWFRGGAATDIKQFEIIEDNKILLDCNEYVINKLHAHFGRSYFQDFVYIECQPDVPTGLYDIGIRREEFALFEGKYISRQEYDRGATIIDGKPISTLGKAELRTRRLTKYNFIIAAKYSPYNCTEFDANSEDYFDKLLKNEVEFQEFVEWMETLPKHRLD